MTFDPCPHHITRIVINAAKEFRRLKGLPEESNITALYKEAAEILKVPTTWMNSVNVNHLPSPDEMKDEKGNPLIPRIKCPNCKKEDGMRLVSICGKCKDSERGLYKSAWICDNCGYKDKSEKFLVDWINEYRELGKNIPDGMKKDLGIKTLTDDGLKD